MSQNLDELKRLLQKNIFAKAPQLNFNSYSQAVFKKLAMCHTIGIGKHYYKCNNVSCNHVHTQYHCCGNRHCMNCGGHKRDQWIQDRMQELLPTTYYHIVFTLPQQLRSLCLGNRKLLFNLLFEASHYTLNTLAQNKKWLGAQPGITSILHTNGQDLKFHPHVHCIVTGGGIDANGKWVKEKVKNGSFIFPKPLLEKTFKTYFLKQLNLFAGANKLQLQSELDFSNLINELQNIRWNVAAKAPFGGPAQIVEYLGRYTHNLSRK